MGYKKVANYNVRFLHNVQGTGDSTLIDITAAELLNNPVDMIYVLVEFDENEGANIYIYQYNSSVTLNRSLPSECGITFEVGGGAITFVGGDNWDDYLSETV